MTKLKKIIISVFCVTLLVSCQERTRFYTDKINSVDVDIKIERFDKDVLSGNIEELKQKYGSFFDLYIYRILNLRSYEELNLFLTDTTVVELYKDAQEKYTVVTDIEKELTTAFKYYKYYFPDKNVPRLMFHVSGFNQCIVSTGEEVSASLDSYLGSDYSMYQYVAYQYEIPYMTREQLPIDMMLGFLTSEFESETGDESLLDKIITQGKIMYLMHVFFPERKMYELLSYSEDQYEWASKYEAQVWGHIIEEKSLFSSDWRTITKYTGPGPFTSGLAQESPARLGWFLGYKIISSYVDKNKELTLQDLINEDQAQKILELSGYNPR